MRRLLVGLANWRLWGLVVLGLLAWAVFMVARWPAAHAWQLVEPRITIPAEVEHGPLSGTIWSGRLHGVSAPGVALDRVDWRVAPASLLRGELVVTMAGRGRDRFIEGDVRVRREGVVVEQLSGRLPVQPFEEVAAEFGGETVRLEGDLTFAVERGGIDWRGQLNALDGRLAWQDAAVTVDQRAELGGITTTLAADGEGGIRGELGDTGGALRLGGNWHLSPDGAYLVEAVADTRPEAAGILTRSLEMAGPRTAEGVVIEVEGAL